MLWYFVFDDLYIYFAFFVLVLQYSAIQQGFDMTFYDYIFICLQLLASVPHDHLLPTCVISASPSSFRSSVYSSFYNI